MYQVEITDVRLRKIETEGKLRAYVSVTFDDSFVVHDLRVTGYKFRVYRERHDISRLRS